MVEDILALVEQLECHVKLLRDSKIDVALLLSLLQTFKKTVLNNDTESEDAVKPEACDKLDLPTELDLSFQLPIAGTDISNPTAWENYTQDQNPLAKQRSNDDGIVVVKKKTSIQSDIKSGEVECSSLMDQDLLSEVDAPKNLMVCKLCAVTSKAGNMEENMGYADWNLLLDHIEEKHAVFNPSIQHHMDISDKESKQAQKQKMKNSLLSCPYCFVKKSTKDSYKDAYTKLCFHLQEKHMETLPNYVEVFNCDLCSYKTYSSRLLVAHNDYNHSEVSSAKNQKVKCTICHKLILQRFMSKHLLVKHNIGADNPKLNADDSVVVMHCEDCGKRIRGRHNFDKHVMRMHLKVKDYLCHTCSQPFFDKKSLSIHMYHKHGINMESKPVLKCMEIGCDFTAITNDILTRHVQTRHASCQYLCTACGKSFKTIHNLKQHEQTMHPDPAGQMYKCPDCNFTSQVKQYVTRHAKVHTTDKKHRCDFAGCSYATHFSENLSKHKKTHINKPAHKSSRRSSKQTPAATSLPVSDKVTQQVFDATPGIMTNAQLYIGQSDTLSSLNTVINPQLSSISTSMTGSVISNSLPSSSSCLLVQSCDYLTPNTTLPSDIIDTKPQSNILTVDMPNHSQCLHSTATLNQHVTEDLTHTLLNITDTDVSTTCPYPPSDQLGCTNSTRQTLYQDLTQNPQSVITAPDNNPTQYLSL